GRVLRRRSPNWRPQAKARRETLEEDEWYVVDLASELAIPKNTLHAWIRRGWVRHRHLEGYRAPCICWAAADELLRLRQLFRTPRGWWDPPLPRELITPRPRTGD